ERISAVLENSIGVTVEYDLGDRSLDRLHVYYIDVEPFEEFSFAYDDSGVTFAVFHFSHYAIVYDTESGFCWILPIIVVMIVLVLLILFIVFRRKKVTLVFDPATVCAVPEGWKKEGGSKLVAKFRRNSELEVPELDYEHPEGAKLLGWYPDLPEKVEKSEEFKAMWSGKEDEE
ncbi:MAG: hypothetical protein IKN41_05950, partial [Candidatus Methanomethylophilaceae archaeon]|nr:hypothetical protein [Candidatus Methanomethylophilaceae archaeon]